MQRRRLFRDSFLLLFLVLSAVPLVICCFLKSRSSLQSATIMAKRPLLSLSVDDSVLSQILESIRLDAVSSKESLSSLITEDRVKDLIQQAIDPLSSRMQQLESLSDRVNLKIMSMEQWRIAADSAIAEAKESVSRIQPKVEAAALKLASVESSMKREMSKLESSERMVVKVKGEQPETVQKKDLDQALARLYRLEVDTAAIERELKKVSSLNHGLKRSAESWSQLRVLRSYPTHLLNMQVDDPQSQSSSASAKAAAMPTLTAIAEEQQPEQLSATKEAAPFGDERGLTSLNSAPALREEAPSVDTFEARQSPASENLEVGDAAVVSADTVTPSSRLTELTQSSAPSSNTISESSSSGVASSLSDSHQASASDAEVLATSPDAPNGDEHEQVLGFFTDITSTICGMETEMKRLAKAVERLEKVQNKFASQA